MDSPSTIKDIIKSGKVVPERYYPGGTTYHKPGTAIFGKYGTLRHGTWELGIDHKTNKIYHFLFKPLK